MNYRLLPPQTELHRRFYYDPSTGVLVWKVRPCSSVSIGDIAGSLDKSGYFKVAVNGTTYLTSRVIWMYVYGVDPADRQVDHADGNPRNNRITNLRLATTSQNCRNKPCGAQQSNSASGLKGVTFHAENRKWRARIQVAGKRLSLGCYPTKEDAEAAIRAKREELHGEFANHG